MRPGELLARNPVSFFLQRRSYSNPLRADSSQLSDNADIVRTLSRDGLCVIENYMDHSTIDDIRSEVAPILWKVKSGQTADGLETSSYPQYGTYILHYFDAFTKSARAFLDDEMILSVLAAITGGRAVPFDTVAELRTGTQKNLVVDDWHADTWKFRFKVMLYLTDVSESNGPLRYLSGSHSGRGWQWSRFVYDYLNDNFGDSPGIQRLCVRIAERQSRNRASREMLCTGPAGTLILFDTRGLHSATTPQEGSRLILKRTFVLREDLA